MDTGNEGLLERLISEKSLQVAFQPIVDLDGVTVLGYEALARGTGPLEMPGALFPCAKALGKSWELEKSCREKALSKAAGPGDPQKACLLFLNASPTIFADPRFPAALSREVGEQTGFSPDRVVVELTEQERLEDNSLLHRQIQHLSEHGFAVALDDFGAGNAGLKVLLECCPSFLKLDRDIIREVDKSAIRRQLVKSLVHFAEAVNTCLIAEGVETWEELETLASIGVRYAQGYLLGRPSFDWAGLAPEVKARLASMAGPKRKRPGSNWASTSGNFTNLAKRSKERGGSSKRKIFKGEPAWPLTVPESCSSCLS